MPSAGDIDVSISFTLNSKVILISGASSGIGQAIARHVSEAGAIVLLSGRNIEKLEETAALCPGESFICPQELNQLDELPKFVRRLTTAYGPLAGLVHSAGVEQTIPLRALKAVKLQEILTINTIAGAMLIKGMAGRGCHSENSSVVVVSSVTGRVSKPAIAGYAMSKGAVEQMIKSLALELIPSGIRVNGIAPAMIRTPMFEKFFKTLSELERSNILRDHPGGIGSPEDVAAAAIFLLSDASKYVTGTSLLVDGGYCAQ